MAKAQTEITCTCSQQHADPDKAPEACAVCKNKPANHNKGKIWQKGPYVVNNFEHRHAAQQRILEMQQKQITEQQKLIEELQYLQKQQMLQQKLLQQESAKVTVGGASSTEGVESIHKTLAHLQSHISKLQTQLTASYEAKPGSQGMVQDIVIGDLTTPMTSQRPAATSDSLRIDLSDVVEQDTRGAGDAGANKMAATLSVVTSESSGLGQTKALSTVTAASTTAKAEATRPGSARYYGLLTWRSHVTAV